MDEVWLAHPGADGDTLTVIVVLLVPVAFLMADLVARRRRLLQEQADQVVEEPDGAAAQLPDGQPGRAGRAGCADRTPPF